MNHLQRIRGEVLRTRRRLEEVAADASAGGGAPAATNFTPPPTVPPVSAVNHLRNGDFSHSVRTWNNGAAGNQDYETAHWFTHDAPVAAQRLDESTGFSDLNIDADANAATNKTLKSSSHASTSASMCVWDRAHGVASLQGTKSLDAPLPSNTATPNAGQMCLGLRAALADSRIVVPSGFRLYAGIWDNTAGQRDWIKAASSFALTATVRGTPGATVERRYKVFLSTDRGYTYISSEATVLAAPSDASFSSTVDVLLSWDLIPGVLEAHVYRYTPGTGTYALLDKMSANSYADNGTTLTVTPPVAAYPTATDDRAKAYVATATGSLDDLPVDGVDPAWESLFFNIPVPSGYNMGVTTDKQWLRIGQNMALDRRVTDAVVNNASANLDSATAVFSALDTGRSVTVTSGANTHTTTITFVDADSVTMAAPWPHASATGATLLITGGGDQGLLLDQVHASYVPNAVYAPHPEDLNRPLPPAAAPNGSSQGGVGSGGGGSALGDGGVACVEEWEPVCVFSGEQVAAVPFREVRLGQALYTGELRHSRVMKKMRGRQPLVLLRAENGVELLCSPSHRVITTRNDVQGRAVETLRTGDSLLTYLRGRVEVSRVAGVWALGEEGEVGTFRLAPCPVYVAGRYAPLGWRERIRLWLRDVLGRPEEPAGILSHNLKRETF